jgi:5-methylcytosine-specific restriction protein A
MTPRQVLRLCLDCGTPCTTTRCPDCTQPRTPRPTSATRTHSERQRRAATVRAWRATQGDWCPGWQREPHQATDLTADHITPIAQGGEQDGELQVLCRPCNSTKAARA